MQIPRRFPDWQVPFILALVCVGVAAWREPARELFRYDRLAIADGQIWRIVSGHLVHLGFLHLALNLAGLVLVWILVGRLYDTKQWLYVIALCMAVISGGFWWLDTDLGWYVGLSGLLHGMLLAGAVQGLRWRPWESALICVLLIAKLAHEQTLGPLPGSEQVAGGQVVVNAHLYGAVGGALAAVAFWRSAREAASI